MAKDGISLGASNTRAASFPAAARRNTSLPPASSAPTAPAVPIAPAVPSALLAVLFAVFLVACLAPLFTCVYAVADTQSAQHSLVSCEGAYDDAGNVTAAGLRLTIPAGLNHSTSDSGTLMDTWTSDDGNVILTLYTEDYGRNVTRENVDTALEPYLDSKLPWLALAMGGEVVSSELVVNDYGAMAYIGRFNVKNADSSHIDFDYFLICIPAPDTVLMLMYTAPDGVYDLKPTVDALVQTVAPEGTVVDAAVEAPALSTAVDAEEADLDSTMTIDGMTVGYSSSWLVSKSGGAIYFYPSGTSNAMIMVDAPYEIPADLAYSSTQAVLEDYLGGVKQGLAETASVTNVSLGTPAFTTGGGVATARASIEFTMHGRGYVGFVCGAVSGTTLYQFMAASYTDQSDRYQPLFQKVWDSVGIPGADLGLAIDTSSRVSIGGGSGSGDTGGSGDASNPGATGGGDSDDSGERSGGRSLSRAKAGAGTGTGGALSR